MSHSEIPFLKRPQVPHNLLTALSAVGQPSLSRLQSKSPSITSIQEDFIILQHQTISEDEGEEREHRPQSGLKKKFKKPGIVLHAFNPRTLGDKRPADLSWRPACFYNVNYRTVHLKNNSKQTNKQNKRCFSVHLKSC